MDFAIVKRHPYATGVVVLFAVIIIFLIMRRRGGGASGGGGVSADTALTNAATASSLPP